jgi:tRNA-2-methylthio-N6-dimethylallyladenosine synthase
MNEYDSSRMGDVLAAAEGMEPTDDPAQADILLVNTCSVREKAESKVFSLLGEWKLLKDAKPGLVIGVGGCVASQEGETLVKAAPQIDLVFGPQTVHRLPEMLGELRGGRRAVVDVRKVRPVTGSARRGCNGFRIDHGRLQQILQFLCGALHPRR